MYKFLEKLIGKYSFNMKERVLASNPKTLADIEIAQKAFI